MDRPTSPQIFDVVLTGGPGGGKTSAIPFLVERLQQQGYAVIVVDEAASRVFSMIPDAATRAAILANPRRNREFQDLLIGAQLGDREQAHRLALLTGSDRVVVLRDRDVIDNAAYIGTAEFASLLSARGLSVAAVRDRAHVVLHLVTAADGAEAFYTTANNQARYETPAQARAQDRRTRAVWTGHRNRAIIDNSTDFAGKLERAWQALAVGIGIPGYAAASLEREVA